METHQLVNSNNEEHLQNLAEVLRHLELHGIRMKKSKCYLLEISVVYLGHQIDSEGLHATAYKVKAMVRDLIPKNLQELGSFLRF